MLAILIEREYAPGNQPLVVTLVPDGPVYERLRDRNIPFFYLRMRAGTPTVVAPPRLARIIRRERPSPIQSWMYHADLMALVGLIPSGRRHQTRLYWGVCRSNMVFHDDAAALRLTFGICTRLSHFADATIYNSDAGSAAHRPLGCRPRRAAVISNGLNIERFHRNPETRRKIRAQLELPEDNVVLAVVARRDSMNGHEVFLDAFERLDDVQAFAVGRGTETLPARPCLHRLGVRDDVNRYLAASDILVSSSNYGEEFSNAIAECMAVGVPAVVANVGDARRIVGDTRIVVAPKDPGSLAEAIQ